MDGKAHRVGLLVAGGMPPPDELRRAMKKDKGDESDDDGGEEESGSMGGRMAFKAMMTAIKSGDAEAGYDAFEDAVRACAAKAKEKPASDSSDSDDAPYT